MKKLIVCLLSIIFCYGFTYSTKEVKPEVKCGIVKKESTAVNKKFSAAGIIKENFHPLMFLKPTFE